MDASELWSGFALDPRVQSHAGLRAADVDRDRIQSVLADAFADGRLDRDEYDDRSAQLVASRTLGELPTLVEDLVAPEGSAATDVVRRSPTDLEGRAVRHWEQERRSAVFGFLGPTLICWVVWCAVMFGEFPWPLIVTAATGLNLARTLASKDDIIERERRRLQKKQARAIEKTDPPELDA